MMGFRSCRQSHTWLCSVLLSGSFPYDIKEALPAPAGAGDPEPAAEGTRVGLAVHGGEQEACCCGVRVGGVGLAWNCLFNKTFV